MAIRTHQSPSGGRNNGASHVPHRGGIQKRGQQAVRLDRDGDLDMDSNGVGRGRGRGRGIDHRHNISKPYTNGHGDPIRDTRRNRVDLSAAQKGVFRAMGDLNTLPKGPRASLRFNNHSSQRSGGTDRQANGAFDQILIRGLAQSKAATNADGGLESLVSWLERKATGTNAEAVRVKKVCLALSIAGSPHRPIWSALVSCQAFGTTTEIPRLCRISRRDLQLQGHKPC